jgi:hypothetical protein
MFRLLAAMSAAAITVAVTGITVASAETRSAAPTSGTEHVQIMSAAPGTPATAIAYGAFTAAGTAQFGAAKLGKLVLNGGTITVSHKPGKGSEHFSPRSCLTSVSQPGTYKIVGGTGRFKGITGHGNYRLTFRMVDVRAKGTCSQTKPPLAQQELIQLTGHVHL